MIIKKFIESTGKDLNQEVEEIDIRNHLFSMEPKLPEEEFIGELNDFERRYLIWLLLMEARMNQVVLSKEDVINPEIMMQYDYEMEEALSKIEVSWKRIFNSLSKRFGNVRLDIREDCKVVISKESEEDALIKSRRRRATILLNTNYARISRSTKQ